MNRRNKYLYRKEREKEYYRMGATDVRYFKDLFVFDESKPFVNIKFPQSIYKDKHRSKFIPWEELINLK